jgi:hypothetical protein
MKKTIATFAAALALFAASCATVQDFGESVAPALGEATEQAIAEWLARQEPQPPAITNAPPPAVEAPPHAVTNAPPAQPATGHAAWKARAVAWYPGAQFYDKQEYPPLEEALWKPRADHGGNLVLILPASKWGRIHAVTLDGQRRTRADSIANQYRPHYRYAKPGGSYRGELLIETDRGNIGVRVQNPAARTIIKADPPR